MTCVVYVTIAGTRVPLARLLGDTLYRNDMGLVRRGFEHKKETGGLDSGLRRNDMGWGEHGHSQGGRALPTEMYAGGLICGRGVLPGDEHKNLTDTPWLVLPIGRKYNELRQIGLLEYAP